MAAYSFDSKSGCRERLFLLSVISLKMDNPANYAYDPHRDTWAHVGGGEKKVRYEASHALEVLASRGIDRETALEMVGYPETIKRFAITHINKDGQRTLAFANQGRNHYATQEAAEEALAQFRSDLQSKLDLKGLEVREVKCHPNGDAIGVWFD